MTGSGKNLIVAKYLAYRDRPEVPAWIVLRRLVVDLLSPREREIFDLLVEGQTTAKKAARRVKIKEDQAARLLHRMTQFGLATRVMKSNHFVYCLDDTITKGVTNEIQSD